MINLKSAQEDVRKIGITVMLAGFADIFFSQQSLYSSYIITMGLLMWILGLIKTRS